MDDSVKTASLVAEMLRKKRGLDLNTAERKQGTEHWKTLQSLYRAAHGDESCSSRERSGRESQVKSYNELGVTSERQSTPTCVVSCNYKPEQTVRTRLSFLYPAHCFTTLIKSLTVYLLLCL